MSEEIVSASQSETTPAPERDSETEALYDSFGLRPTPEKKEIEFPDLSKGDAPKSEEGTPPAIEGQPTEPKTMKVKFNKEDVDVDISDEKLPEHLQRSLALDKERERKAELEKNLDRAAKLAGFKDHAEYVANFDKLEQQQQQKQQDEYQQLRSDLRAQAEDAGLDPDKVEAWLDNHPLMKQAKQAVQEREASQQERQKAAQDETWNKGWSDFYAAFPELAEDSKKFEAGGRADFYSPEMESMVSRGLTPKEAYTLLNMDKIQTQSAKKVEQKIIKQQHLGARSAVEGQASSEPDGVTLLPEQMALAAEFGVKIDGVKNQQKQLNSRR